jgi:thiol-disulfide isomerase/thioredoxin
MNRMMRWLSMLGCAALIVTALPQEGGKSPSANLLPADPVEAWKVVESAFKVPPPPAEWGVKPPTHEQKEGFDRFLGEQAALGAAKAREFHTRFPQHAKAADAKEAEKHFLKQAVALGNKTAAAKVEADLTDDEKLERKVGEVHRRAMAKKEEGLETVLKEFESGIRDLMKEYPKRAELWQHMLMVAFNTQNKDHAKRLLEEVVASDVAAPEVAARAKAMLKATGAVGQPLELSFTAADGKAVDIQKMKGKVVMIDFWASWCGPCMMTLPRIVKFYEEYRPKGFEIVGINMDKDQRAMNGALQRFKMTWPQYFDGLGWGNKFAVEYGVTGIPSVWLVDKKGVLRSMETPEDDSFADKLEQKIKKLLAENVP